jgi:hypothetical protein
LFAVRGPMRKIRLIIVTDGKKKLKKTDRIEKDDRKIRRVEKDT